MVTAGIARRLADLVAFDTQNPMGQERPLVDKLAHVRYMQQRAQVLDRRIVQAQVNYSDTTTDSIYIGRGRRLRQRITRTLLAALVAAGEWHLPVRYIAALRRLAPAYRGARPAETGEIG